MPHHRHLRAAAYALGCVSFASAIWAAESIPANVIEGVREAERIRIPEDLVRDGVRQPEAVLSFAGIKQGAVVADFIPGDAYYTRILFKAVGAKGKVYEIGRAHV